MISVAQALDHLRPLITPTDAEVVPIQEAHGRVLIAPLAALRTQPPFPASAMDGYAVAASDAVPGRSLRVIGEAAAGHGFPGEVTEGEAIRIFTGAPVPTGATHVIIQEDVTRTGDRITVGDTLGAGDNIRPAGTDFHQGELLNTRGPLGPADVALLASMGHGSIAVHRKPVVALIPTGDELVPPGTLPGPDQIISSNTYGLAAQITRAGGIPRILPIARDRMPELLAAISLAEEADLIVTLGGASVGDHDLVKDVPGLDLAFYKIAMRPGKPLMAGRFGQVPMIGLPGNPVSAMVCGEIFLTPALAGFFDLPIRERPRSTARLAQDIAANGPREHYMRAIVTDTPDGAQVEVLPRQDSSLLTVLAHANALAVRPIGDPCRRAGEIVKVLRLSP
ncbi:MAG: gephyrin-like molybdotransferase Glp [Pseudomonadota bacterium]